MNSVQSLDTCNPGKIYNVDNAKCVNCDRGKFKGSDDTTCQDCPAGKTSPPGADSADRCYDCDAGTYKGPGHTTCQACPPDETSPPGATSADECTASKPCTTDKLGNECYHNSKPTGILGYDSTTKEYSSTDGCSCTCTEGEYHQTQPELNCKCPIVPQAAKNCWDGGNADSICECTCWTAPFPAGKTKLDCWTTVKQCMPDYYIAKAEIGSGKSDVCTKCDKNTCPSGFYGDGTTCGGETQYDTQTCKTCQNGGPDYKCSAGLFKSGSPCS